ncbi:hypothetical protein [Piscinibacter sp. XHJ-5]|uniref:hypothetical protein n=1 Tax=Piscinibacter sp. XHJ-5 TaxID=3037797 RepID=UPI0024534971|nr:hypothetical protein [Piscinibacter sp. XHJ-5]
MNQHRHLLAGVTLVAALLGGGVSAHAGLIGGSGGVGGGLSGGIGPVGGGFEGALSGQGAAQTASPRAVIDRAQDKAAAGKQQATDTANTVKDRAAAAPRPSVSGGAEAGASTSGGSASAKVQR